MCWVLLVTPVPILYLTPNFLFQFDPFFGTWGFNGLAAYANIIVGINNSEQNLLFYSPELALAIYALIVVYLIVQV